MKCLYLAHPVSGDVPANIARALRWLKFLRRHTPDVVIACPWIASILSGEDDADPAQRARGLQDCIEVVQRFDGVILVGGRISDGMRLEGGVVEGRGEIFDLTHLGEEPPEEWPSGVNPLGVMPVGFERSA